MDYIIRKATTKDVKDVNTFLSELIKDEKQYDKNINEDFIVQYYYEDFILDNNHCILVAEINKKIVGYLYGFIINSETVYINTAAQLDALYIDKYYRNKGIAQKLIEYFKDWVKTKDAKYIEVKVCNQNSSAVSLYKKENFMEFKSIMSFELKD